MEIVFNNVSYVVKNVSSVERSYLNDFSLKIDSGKITGLVGSELSVIGNLIMAVKRPSKGDIKIGDVVIKRTSHLSNVGAFRKNVGFVYNSFRYVFYSKTVLEEIKEVMSNYDHSFSNVTKRISDSLRIVGLGLEYLDRDPNTLSYTEQKKLVLASILSYNPKVIVLENFEKGFNEKERDYFRKLLLKLKNNFKKTIIVITDELNFLFELVDKFHVINKGELVYNGDKKSFFDDELYNFVKMPKIVEFIKYAKNEGHNILEYTDTKELLKELYRCVK